AQPQLSLAHPLAQAADELLGEEHHVLAALAQRWQVNREDAQPVVEILAELATRHGVGEVPVGGDDEAKVGLERHGAADPLELALLEDTEKFGLDGRREFAHLVEKECAPGGELEAARFLLVRSGEGAPFMAEELRLDERVWQRRAVDGDAGALGPTAGIVDRQPSGRGPLDRKSTRLNSSHGSSSYAVFGLKKKRAAREGSTM